MIRVFAKTMFVILFPLITVLIIGRIIIEDTRDALRSMYFQIRIEIGSLPRVWRRIDEELS
jgi:hypothetical protein